MRRDAPGASFSTTPPMGSSARVASTYHPSLDIVGATASVVCAVHCAGVALLLGIVPALQMVAQPWVDWYFLSASTMVGLMALIPGFRQHRHPMPLVMFVGGITALARNIIVLPPVHQGRLSHVGPRVIGGRQRRGHRRARSAGRSATHAWGPWGAPTAQQGRIGLGVVEVVRGESGRVHGDRCMCAVLV